MSVFQDEEIEYLKSQLLGRLATVGPDGQPHVVPVSFRYNADSATFRFMEFSEVAPSPEPCYIGL